MSEAVAKRRAKPIKVDHRGKPKAQVLKFDRRGGLVVMENSESNPQPQPFSVLVRNLLAWLRLIPPVPAKKQRAKGKRSQ